MNLENYPSPVTDSEWQEYNRGKHGLHHVAHKMRELEQKLAATTEFINELCNANGRFQYLNGTSVVSATYETLQKIS